MKYYHNPRCSKSRQALGFLPDGVEIINYLKEEIPVSVYISILQRYDGLLSDLLRTREPPAKGLDLTTYSHEELGHFLSKNPIVLQRPILDDGEKITIGRPVETFRVYFRLNRHLVHRYRYQKKPLQDTGLEVYVQV